METVAALLGAVTGWLWVIPIILLVLFWKIVLRIFGIWLIPEDSIGIVEKKFVLFAKLKSLPDGRIVALNGEAGLQADTLPPGLKFFLWPWQFRVTIVKFTFVPQGKVGIVEAKDGNAIPAGRVLARMVECDTFQDARKFLMNNGERGTQIAIMPPGVYRVNTHLFDVKMVDAISIPDNTVGVVTVKEGQPLATGEIAGKRIDGHNSFQDGHTFVMNGGYKGQQEEVILAGTYYLNPHFVQVEKVEMTDVPIGHVGVVVSYVGDNVDGKGEQFKHGKLVERGQKGVWKDPLDPGMYPINPLTTKIELVPTTNIVLNWASAKTASHELDSHLSTITARSSDGFTYNLDVSQIIHVSRDRASAVIARFGSMSNLVSQVLEPLIGNYFRNSAQAYDAIAFLTGRAERQQEAKEHIQLALEEAYDVQAVDTLIGDIVPPPELMQTLSEKKLAERLKETYEAQRATEDTRKDLENARATAETQAKVVAAGREVEIRTFNANAAIEAARGEAEAKKTNADADAYVFKTVGEGEASQVLAVGTARADVQKRLVESVGPEGFSLMAIADHLSKNGTKLVPDVNVSGGGVGANGTLVDALLGSLVSGRFNLASATGVGNGTVAPVAEVTDDSAKGPAVILAAKVVPEGGSAAKTD